MVSSAAELLAGSVLQGEGEGGETQLLSHWLDLSYRGRGVSSAAESLAGSVLQGEGGGGGELSC